jgi:diacylglycerol kinase family enzyme
VTLGLNAQLIKNYEDSAVHGKLGYAWQAINTLIADAALHATISANAEVVECNARMIVANASNTGTV